MSGDPSAFKVLVVEDQLLVAMELETTLAALGWTLVGPAATLKRALEFARRDVLDGAILDINLNGILVFPVAEELLGRGIPFVFVTGYSEHPAMPERLKAVPLLQKPFDPARLAQLLASALPGAAPRNAVLTAPPGASPSRDRPTRSAPDGQTRPRQ